jgi:tetratricopeptide (TPR) repeat protein
MSAIGRNEPCPCGSGKKYKKCCLPVADAQARLAAVQREHRLLSAERDRLQEEIKDNLSELTLHLIEARRLDEAEVSCRELRDRFPEDPIGLERLARLEEARGSPDAAVSLYRQALAMVDDDLDRHFRNEMVKAIQRLQPN